MAGNSYWQRGFNEGYAGERGDACILWKSWEEGGYWNGFRAGQDKRQRELFEERQTVTIPLKEYKALLEYKAMYEGVSK